MLCATINDETAKSSVVIVVIEKDNLEAMKRANPITLGAPGLSSPMLKQAKYPGSLSLVIAYEEDDRKLYELVRARDLRGLLAYVTRGYRFDPDVDGGANVSTLGPRED